MKHRWLNFCAAVSLLLCFALLALWVRSYWRLDIVAKPERGIPSGVLRMCPAAASYRGRLMLMLARQRATYGEDGCFSTSDGDADLLDEWLISTPYSQTPHHALGFGFQISRTFSDEYVVMAFTPIWC